MPPTGIRYKSRRSKTVGWIVAENGCHIWQGVRNSMGYGRVYDGGRMHLVHRLRYEREVGAVPEGMMLDHFACNNRCCCNPLHVRPVTQRENVLRSEAPPSIHAAKTHCPQGHPYSGDNLYVAANNSRQCRTCQRRHGIARRERIAAERRPA